MINQTCYKPDTASFYLNDIKVEFDPAKFYSFTTELQKPYYISTDISNITTTKIFFEKEKTSTFLIVLASKYTFVVNRNKLDPNNLGLVVYGLFLNFGKNVAYKLKYQEGRLLVAVYK